ncbi:hypothetical protein DEO72_LG3g2198 [Vigna unguiculata]|uniref:Uncharacterized protein n=1 Tax=Vigna unguiculata TaxID=3917 RepID=A0A4D6LG76_VIGUN|nr:hypothetical protein DEO72_LG3g2198 [Vigna unguiculata]
MAMSHEDMLKRARQLKKQKTTTAGASPSAPLPRIELHEETSELDLEPLTRNSELLKDQIGSSLNMGFQLALDQVHVLYPDADLSSANISKSVVNGQLVDIDD